MVPGNFPLVYSEYVLLVASGETRGVSVEFVYLLFPLDPYIIILRGKFEAFSVKNEKNLPVYGFFRSKNGKAFLLPDSELKAAEQGVTHRGNGKTAMDF